MVAGKFNMGGILFTGVAGNDIDLDDVTFTNLQKGEDTSSSDILQVWDPQNSGYTTYHYYNAEGDEDNWGWVDENWELPDSTLPVGTAFWFKAKPGETRTMTVAGGIESADEVTYEIVGGKFNMFINPFPAEIDLNDSKTVSIANYQGGEDTSTSDILQVWDPQNSGYTTYHYYNAEGDEDNWGWVDENWELPDAKLAAGTPFWFKAKPGEGKSITFFNPTK